MNGNGKVTWNRIKSISDRDSKIFWVQQYKIYKKVLNGTLNLDSVLPKDPYVIKFAPNPTPKQQLYAVCANPKVIKYIKNQDEYAALRAVKENPTLIEYVKNPTEEMWLHVLPYYPIKIFDANEVTWPMFNLVANNVFGLNIHSGLNDEMRAYLKLVA